MTVYCCPLCKKVLTFGAFRGKENVCIPHCDDWYSCEGCGGKLCGDCGQDRKNCRLCEGKLHFNKSFEPTGIYRLPSYLRSLKTLNERLERIEQDWESGIMGSGEYEYLIKVSKEESAS